TATVMRTWATVPPRLARMIWSGPSQGMEGPEVAATPWAASPRTPPRIRMALHVVVRAVTRSIWVLRRDAGERFELVARGRLPPGDLRELAGATALGGASDEDNEVDGLRHEPGLGRDARFLHEGVEPHQGRAGAVGVDRREAPRMP